MNNPAFVTANGVSLRYEIVGEGPPLCLINGFRLHGGAWPTAFVQRLAARFSVLTYDSRGTGLSDKPIDDYGMPTLARDAAGVISGTGFSSAHVLGFSMGGAVAQELVIRYPFCVDRLVLFSTYAGVGFTIPAAWDAQRRLFEVDSLSAEEAARQVWPVTYSPEFLKRNLPFVEAQMRREIATPTPDYVARGQRAGLRRFSSGLRLWQICACTLVITGDEDQLIPPGNSRLIASMIRGAHFESFSGLGHRAIWEAPEKIADFVIDFLEASK